MADKSGKQVAADEVWIAARIPKTAKARLDRWAKRKETSISWIVRRLINEALDQDRDEGNGL